MKYKLINPPNHYYSAKQQVLINRGIAEQDLVHYMNLTDADISDPFSFGKQTVTEACELLMHNVAFKNKICIIVDSDCDGFTSSAILINYLYDLSPDYTRENVFWFFHEGKQHGLEDAMDWIHMMDPDLVIIPDAGSNDLEEIQLLSEDRIGVIVLDHHDLEGERPNVLLINSQLQPYQNKELSGAGVVYQFCRAMDIMYDSAYADSYLDLCALGLIGDMMSLRSFETRRLITLGLIPNNIKNPFIYEMWQKNKFKLTDTPTAWGFTFYIVPFVNAINRSGTAEEKALIFNSMLKFKAFEEIPSNKRGHKLGETEKLVEQAVRTCTNVKNRQTRDEEKGLELVEHLIKENNMMDHKVLLFLLEPGSIKAEIRGLIANKLMAKYQRPCCMLTKRIKQYEGGEIESSKGGFPVVHGAGEEYIIYEGSARGCDKVDVTNFKGICAETELCEYTVGHPGAFGLGLRADNLSSFVDKTDKALEDMASEPTYYVDYIWHPNDVDSQSILDIADLAPYWGKDIDESLIAIKGIKITKEQLTMMASNTVKITLPNGIAMIKFKMPDEEYNKLYSEDGFVEIDAVCRCNKNEWGGRISPQLLIESYEIVGGCAYVF